MTPNWDSILKIEPKDKTLKVNWKPFLKRSLLHWRAKNANYFKKYVVIWFDIISIELIRDKERVQHFSRLKELFSNKEKGIETKVIKVNTFIEALYPDDLAHIFKTF